MGAYVIALLAFPVDFGPQVGGVVLSVSRLVLLAAIAFAIADWRELLSAARRVPTMVWVGWLAFLGSALVTAATIPSSASWARYGSLVVEGLVVFLLVYRAALAPSGLRTLLIVVATTTVAVAGIALLLVAFGNDYDRILSAIAGTEPVYQPSARFGLERQAGPFRGALYFGIWMTVASALLLPALAEGPPRLRRLAGAAWVVLLVAVAVLTVSRLAVTAMFVVPGVYFLVRGRRPVGVACLALAVVVGAVFSVLSLDPEIAGAAPGETGNVLYRSSVVRFAAYQATLEALRVHPLFGWGLLNDMSVVGAIIGRGNWVDSIYLSYLVEMGIVGTGSFVLLLVAILRVSRRTWQSAAGLALGIALAGGLVMGAFASTLTSTQMYAAFFVLAALALAAASRMSDARNDLVLGPEAPAPLVHSIGSVPPERVERQAEPGAQTKSGHQPTDRVGRKPAQDEVGHEGQPGSRPGAGATYPDPITHQVAQPVGGLRAARPAVARASRRHDVELKPS